MTRVQSLWSEFGAAKSRLAQVFAEPTGLFDEVSSVPADDDGKVVRLHDAKRKTARKRTRKPRGSKKA